MIASLAILVISLPLPFLLLFFLNKYFKPAESQVQDPPEAPAEKVERVNKLIDDKLRVSIERLDEITEEVGKLKSQVSALSLSAGLRSARIE